MEDFEIKPVEWDELAKSFPPVVYKYRDWSDLYNKTIITKLQVFMAAPTSFEDKFDCKNHIRYDLLTDEQIRGGYYEFSWEKEPYMTIEQRVLYANERFKTSALRDKARTKVQQEKDFFEYDERTGILSLTANPTSAPMWKKYSKDHTGFCVGFNSTVMFKFLGGGHPVEYVDELPVIMPAIVENEASQMFKQIYYKQKKWAFEEEYRTQTFNYSPLGLAGRIRTLTPESYKEIIFGAKMAEETRREIIEVARKRLPHIEFKMEMIAMDGVITIEQYVETMAEST